VESVLSCIASPAGRHVGWTVSIGGSGGLDISLVGFDAAVQHREVAALVIVLVLLALAVLSPFAVDSRRRRDPIDRYWWPAG